MYQFILLVKVDHDDIDETFQVSMWSDSIVDVLDKTKKIYKDYTDLDVEILLEKILTIKEGDKINN